MIVADLPEAMFADATELWREVGLTRPWNDPVADLERAATGTSSTVLAAKDADGALLGTAMVGHDGHRGWVYYVAVQPRRQGQGIGRALMHACEGWLRARDVPKIQLMVRRGNAGVAAFYEALGYEESEVLVLGRRLDRE